VRIGEDISTAATAQGWVTAGLTGVLILVTAWYAYLTYRMARSSERAAHSAKVSAEASLRAASVALATAAVDFQVDLEYVAAEGFKHAGARFTLARDADDRSVPEGFVPARVLLRPLNTAVFVHGAKLVTVGHTMVAPDTEGVGGVLWQQSVDLSLEGAPEPVLLHPQEAIALPIPDLQIGESPEDEWIKGDSIDLVACRVSYSFDGHEPLRERLVANYDHDAY
jgi:hypothetical protein